MTNKQPELLFYGFLCQDYRPYRWHLVILLHVVKYRMGSDSRDQIKSESAWAGECRDGAECLNRLLCEGERLMIVAGRLRH